MSNKISVKLPDIGEGVVEGEVIEWLKAVGEKLGQDEPVVVVMTDKATVELPAPHPGILIKQYYQVGQLAKCGEPLYDIEIGDFTSRALATPATRKLAKDKGIDINAVTGTGNEGRVTSNDLKNFHSKAEKTDSLGDQECPLVGIQALMAKKMTESKRLIPHFSFHEKVEATRLIKLRENMLKEAAKENIQITYMPFFLRALSLTIDKYPIVNSSFDSSSNKLCLHKRQNIGIAISTKRGLIVPVLREIQGVSIKRIILAYEELKKKALEDGLQSHDMKDGTITISNYGVLGGEGSWATPIINYPEVAILALNRIQKQPAVKNNEVVVKDILNVSWSFDHRVIDGNLAAHISAEFSSLLKNPARLL